MTIKKDLIGQRFGKLVVIKEGEKVGHNRTWYCQCDCGKTSRPHQTSLIEGRSKSCGCTIGEKHGLSSHKLAKVWYDMHYRCYNINHQHYHNYGKRGVIVCERWHSLELFIEDLQNSYATHKQKNSTTQLDRIDVNGNYEPSNCRWVTSLENCNNKRNNKKFIAISPNGEKFEAVSRAQFAKEFNLNPSTISACLNKKRNHHKHWTFYYENEN